MAVYIISLKIFFWYFNQDYINTLSVILFVEYVCIKHYYFYNVPVTINKESLDNLKLLH